MKSLMSQSAVWTWDDAGHKKTPVVLVDFRQSGKEQQQFRRRYAFVDWCKAATCFTGFDEHAVELLESA